MSMLFAILFLQATLMQSVEGSGACMSAADQKVWEGGIKERISSVQQDCIMKGAPGAAWYDHCIKHFMNSSQDGEKCMANCVEKRTQLSDNCSQCFGRISSCIYKNCVSSCIDSKSPGCIDCGNKYCTQDFVQCSGITDLPHTGASLSLLTSAEVLSAIPDFVKKAIHNFVCKQLESRSTKENVAAAVCAQVHNKTKVLPEGACETVAKLVWEHEEVQLCKSVVAKAAELRRWEGSRNCTGTYTSLSTDNMNECTSYLIPAPASIWVEQKNGTAYSSYHCQGVLDCSKEVRKLLGDFIVGTCEDFGDYSQMRVWISNASTLPLVVV